MPLLEGIFVGSGIAGAVMVLSITFVGEGVAVALGSIVGVLVGVLVMKVDVERGS